MTTPINIYANSNAAIRAALTATDQTYGFTEAGFKLQAIDNSGQGQVQPW